MQRILAYTVTVTSVPREAVCQAGLLRHSLPNRRQLRALALLQFLLQLYTKGRFIVIVDLVISSINKDTTKLGIILLSTI